MRLTKEQQETLRVIAFDLNCISSKADHLDNIYHLRMAKDNINELVKELKIKVIPESE